MDPGSEGRGTGRVEALVLEEILARYLPLAVRLARGIVGQPHAAEDVAQDAARALLERQRAGGLRLDSREHARNYFLRTVHNLALDARADGERRRARSLSEGPETRAPQADPVRELTRRETGSAQAAGLQATLGRLRPAERELLRLRYLEGLAYREIAERTGLSISTLHSRVTSVLDRIRGQLGKRRPGG